LAGLNFVNDGNTLAVTPSNGYGLEFTGTSSFNKNFTTISVGTATASNVVQGLTLSGQVSGTATGGVAFTKIGAGTLVLSNASNNFVGNIVIGTGTNTASFGVLAFNSDAALGDASNTVTLNGGGSTGTATIRAYGGGSIATSRTFNLWGNSNAANIVEVAPNTTLTLNSPLGLPAGSGLVKSDTGTLVLAANNGSFAGNINVNGGIVRFTNSAAGGLPGAGVTAIGNNRLNTAIELAGVSTFESFSLFSSGVNNAGSLRSTTSTNTVYGSVSMAGSNDATVGTDAGVDLYLRGGINNGSTGALTFNVSAGSKIVIDTIGINATAYSSAATTGINKVGPGVLAVAVASPNFQQNLFVNAGTFYLGGPLGGGAGSLGQSSNSGTQPGPGVYPSIARTTLSVSL